MMAMVKVLAVASVLAVCTVGIAAETPATAPISVNMRGWISDEKRSISSMESEGFAESIDMMADYDSNYFKLVFQDELSPTLPVGLKRTLYSRRFAKLLEDTSAGVAPDQRVAIQEEMRHDMAQYRKLVEGGQGYNSKTAWALKKHGTRSEELLVPLTFRINAEVLLVGERCITECLPEVVLLADVMGEDTNWCAAAYACDKILTQMNSAAVSDQRRQVLAEYATWREQHTDTGLFAYRSEKLPSFRSAQRPFERATSMGAPVDQSGGTIIVEVPVLYKVLMTSSSDGKIGYLDESNKTSTAKAVVAFARRVAAVK